MRIARVVSHLGIGADRQPRLCMKPLGYGAVPTFFWAGKRRHGARQSIGKSLIHMGDWRDTHRSQ
jgi:hypothetical protein